MALSTDHGVLPLSVWSFGVELSFGVYSLDELYGLSAFPFGTDARLAG